MSCMFLARRDYRQTDPLIKCGARNVFSVTGIFPRFSLHSQSGAGKQKWKITLSNKHCVINISALFQDYDLAFQWSLLFKKKSLMFTLNCVISFPGFVWKKQLSFFFIYNLNLQDTRVQKELTHKLDSYVMHKGKPERWLVLTLIKTFTFIHVFASVRKS